MYLSGLITQDGETRNFAVALAKLAVKSPLEGKTKSGENCSCQESW
jgi:hypothetical protein